MERESSESWPFIDTVASDKIHRIIISVFQFLGPISHRSEPNKFFRTQWVIFDPCVPDKIKEELRVNHRFPLIVLRVPGQEDERAVFSWQTGPEDGKIRCFQPFTGMEIIAAPHLLQPCHGRAPVPGDLLEQWLQLWIKAE